MTLMKGRIRSGRKMTSNKQVYKYLFVQIGLFILFLAFSLSLEWRKSLLPLALGKNVPRHRELRKRFSEGKICFLPSVSETPLQPFAQAFLFDLVLCVLSNLLITSIEEG